MKKLLFIALFFVSTLQGNSQVKTFESPDQLLESFFTISSQTSDSARAALLKTIFIENGQVNAILLKEDGSSVNRLGSWQKFIVDSKSFYNRYALSFDEVERNTNFYQDIASIHSLVYQTVTDKQTPNLVYEQLLWYTFDFVYVSNSWFISSVCWVNSIDKLPIDDALLQDTIWHPLNK